MNPKVFSLLNNSRIFISQDVGPVYGGNEKPTHQYELQALALRTKEIYTTELLELPKDDVEICVDIESIPEQRFHYLIGVLVSKQNEQQFYSFWAGDFSEEKSIWESFIETVNRYPSAPVFHYRSYEKNVISELGGRYDKKVDEILERLCNVNKNIYGRIYFPTRTNRLKDICNYLGFSWTEKGVSGLDSIVWRYVYDKTYCETIKNDLILYNQEDCVNLKKLMNIVSAICLNKSVVSGVKAVNDENQLLSPGGTKIVDDFSILIKSAHGKYEQSKITLGKKKKGVKKILKLYQSQKLTRKCALLEEEYVQCIIAL